MLLQGRYGFPALWEQQPHACCLLRNFLPHQVNPEALSSYWPSELLKMLSPRQILSCTWAGRAVIKWYLLFIDKSAVSLICSDGVFMGFCWVTHSTCYSTTIRLVQFAFLFVQTLLHLSWQIFGIIWNYFKSAILKDPQNCSHISPVCISSCVSA